ncbi:MFS transporter [Nocardioides sp. AN3]
MTLQAAPTTPSLATARAFVPLVAAAGFSMSLTAPLEVLFAQDIGYGTTLIALFMLTSSLGVIVVDVLGTRFVPALDARRCLPGGTALFAIACLAMAFTTWWPLMMCVRMVQGFGSGLLIGAGLQASSRLSPSDTRRAVARYNMAFLLGGAIGSPGGLLLAALLHGIAGYRVAFALAGALAAGIAALMWRSLPTLPAPEGSRAVIGLPRFERASGTVAALLLAMVGDFLRGGVLFCALPLVGGERGYGTLTIGIAIALMSCVEVVGISTTAHLVPRLGIAGVLLCSLVVGLGCAMTLALDTSVGSYLVVAAVFGAALAGKTLGLPLMVVGRVGDSASGLARFRISAGLGMTLGATGCAAVGTRYGASAMFWSVATVLGGGIALVVHLARREPHNTVSASAQ